jgi:thiamine transport system permease protein
VSRLWLAPVAAGTAILAAVAGAIGGLWLSGQAEAQSVSVSWLWQITRFTLVQAALSAILATLCAVPVARALARRGHFPGRPALLRLLTLPLVLPTLAAVLGIISAFGSSGWINQALAAAGMPFRLPLYGLTGILLAHVFFNMPLAVRLLLQAWSEIPGETWRSAAQLGMSGSAIFRWIEWPLLRRHAPGIAGLIFLLCVSSFTPVLTLGGGPAATTLEVAIYQSLRFDFAPGQAALLAGLQLLVCAAALALWQGLSRPMAEGTTLGRSLVRHDAQAMAARLADGAILTAAACFIALPLLSLVIDGLGPAMVRVLADPDVWRATALSLSVSAAAAALSIMLSGGLLAGAAHVRRFRQGGRLAAPLLSLGFTALMVPPFVLGTGWFILLRAGGDPLRFAPAVVIAVNALMTLPYVIRALEPAAARTAARYGNLSDSLGLAGWTRFRLVEWPGLRRAFALSLGLCLALSLGDLGAAALFGSSAFTTLPLLLYQRMGAYRSDEAAALALLLALLCLALFALAERLGGRDEQR